MSVRDGDSHICGEDSRADCLAGVYIVADARIGVLNSADGSYGRNSAVELHLSRAAADGLDYLAEKIVARHYLNELLRVGLLLLRLAARGKVEMHIDKTGHYIFSAEVYLLVSGDVRVPVNNGGYLLAIDKNYLAGLRLHILSTVENDAVYKCVFHFFGSSLKKVQVRIVCRGSLLAYANINTAAMLKIIELFPPFCKLFPFKSLKSFFCFLSPLNGEPDICA